ncbi:MAG: hypothetical protein ABWY12_08205 [Burkholderiales bacterium]
MLVLEGDRDTFGTTNNIGREIGGRGCIRIVPVDGTDHGMNFLESSPLTAKNVAALVTASVADFLDDVLR